MAKRGAQYSAAIQLTVTGAQQIKKDIGQAAADAADAAEAATGGKRPTGVQQPKTLGRRRAGNFMFEMARAAEDFGQQLTISLDQAIRASANNVTQAFAVTGNQMLGMAASVTTALYFMVPVLTKLADGTDKWGNHVDILRGRFKRLDRELLESRGLKEYREALAQSLRPAGADERDVFQKRSDDLDKNIERLQEEIDVGREGVLGGWSGLEQGKGAETLMSSLLFVRDEDLRRLMIAYDKVEAAEGRLSQAVGGGQRFGPGAFPTNVDENSQAAREAVRNATKSYMALIDELGVDVSKLSADEQGWLDWITQGELDERQKQASVAKQINTLMKENSKILTERRTKAQKIVELESELATELKKQKMEQDQTVQITKRQHQITLTDKLKKSVKALNVELKSERGLRSFAEQVEATLMPNKKDDPWIHMGDELRRSIADIEDELKRIDKLKKRHIDERREVGFDPGDIKDIDAQVKKLNRQKIDAEQRLAHLGQRQNDIAARRLQLRRDEMAALRQMGMLTESNTEAEMAALRRAKDEMISLQVAAGKGQWALDPDAWRPFVPPAPEAPFVPGVPGGRGGGPDINLQPGPLGPFGPGGLHGASRNKPDPFPREGDGGIGTTLEEIARNTAKTAKNKTKTVSLVGS